MEVPKNYMIVKGIGKSRYPLVAFDNALRNAGIGDYNLVKVSSIIPANCKRSATIDLSRGSIVYCAYSTITISNGDQGKVGVAIAFPSSKEENGVIFECSHEENPELALREMCNEAMYNRNKQISDLQVLVQEAIGEKDVFVSAVAAVVLW